jgi:hypothetical protein
VVIVGAVGREGAHRPADVAQHLLLQVDSHEPLTILR